MTGTGGNSCLDSGTAYANMNNALQITACFLCYRPRSSANASGQDKSGKFSSAMPPGTTRAGHGAFLLISRKLYGRISRPARLMRSSGMAPTRVSAVNAGRAPICSTTILEEFRATAREKQSVENFTTRVNAVNHGYPHVRRILE